MPDRPAAELLAEWEAHPLPIIGRETPRSLWFAVLHFGGVLQRLARAEQALAAVAALHPLGEFEMGACCGEFPFPCRTVIALRASQGGQT